MPRKFLLSLLIEFGPIFVFFIVAVSTDFFKGVAALLIATILSLMAARIWQNRIPLFSLLASGFTIIFGVATLAFHNPYWVVLEYTLYNAGFALALLVAYLFYDKPLLKVFFESFFAVTERGWVHLSMRWAMMFLIVAIGNELVWHLFPKDVWVWYRFISAVALCVFGFSQFFLTRRERLPEATEWGLSR